MIWLYIGKIYAFIFGFLHDKVKYNIRGFGFVMRRIKVDAILNLHGSKVFFDHREAVAYSRVLAGAFNEPETHIFLNRLAVLMRYEFIEIGGSIGEILIDIARNPNVVFSHVFEPNPKCARIIRVNLCLNDLHNVVIEDAAVGDINGSVKMFFGLNSPTASVLSSESRGYGQHVKLVKLDSYFYSYHFKNDIVMLVDVEGYEPQVFSGALEIINKHQPIIIFEYNSDSRKHYHISEIVNILGNSYTIYRLRSDGRLDDEIDASFNCVAVSNKHKKFLPHFHVGSSL